jgi:hypothetical protein
MERSLNCGGFCYTPLFGIATDVSEGRPSRDCVDKLVDGGFD